MAQQMDAISGLNIGAGLAFNRQTSVFITTKVRDLLFDGIKFCDNLDGGSLGERLAARVLCSTMGAQESDTIISGDGFLSFAFFRHKNTTHDGIFTVSTGIKDARDTNTIQLWNSFPEITTWLPKDAETNSECNQIRGTDGSSFSPFQESGGILATFSTDICRVVDVYYDKEIEYKGIDGFRYTTRGSFLSEIGPDHGNQCFCVDQLTDIIQNEDTGCLLKGALDLTSCLSKSPQIL